MVTGKRLNVTAPSADHSSAGGYWRATAQHWALIGPPLRPSPQDVRFVDAAVESWVRIQGAPRALILGVTPELYRLPWPEGTQLQAVDHTRDMIEAVWPGPPSAVLRADWTALPLPDHSRDIALCDGGLILVSFPDRLDKFVRVLRRVLAPGGLFVTRLFVPPRQRESVDQVLDDLCAGRIANLNLLKLRLGMALQATSAHGVRLGDVWDTLHRAVPDLAILAERIGWPIESLRGIDGYQSCPNRYHFSELAEIRRRFCTNPGGFGCASIDVPTYELGERCPTVVFRRDASAGVSYQWP